MFTVAILAWLPLQAKRSCPNNVFLFAVDEAGTREIATVNMNFQNKLFFLNYAVQKGQPSKGRYTWRGEKKER